MGLPLVAVGQLAFSFYNVAVESLAPARIQTTIPTLQIVVVRFLITYLGCVSWMKLARIPHPFLGPPEVRGLLLMRGITGFAGVGFAVYHSLGYLTSDSTTLSFLTPCLTGFMGHLFLGEPFTPRELVSAFTSFLGVICITKPHAVFGGRDEDFLVSESGQTLGAGWGIGEGKFAVALGLLGVAGASAAYTIIAAIGRRAHPLHVVAAFSGSSVVASILGMIVFKIPPVLPPTMHAFGLLLCSGLLGFAGQVAITMGLQGEKAGRGSLVLYLQVIFSGAVERLVLRQSAKHLSVLSVLGSAIIVLSAWFGTFAKSPPAILFSPLPMPASSPKVSRASSQQFLRPLTRDRRDSLAQKRSMFVRPEPDASSARGGLSGVLESALKAWRNATATLKMTRPLSRPVAPADVSLYPRTRSRLSPPLPSPTDEKGGLQLELDAKDAHVAAGNRQPDRPWRVPMAQNAGDGASQLEGRKSPRPPLAPLDTRAPDEPYRPPPQVVVL